MDIDDKRLREGYSVSQKINRLYGKSYYWATQFFPPEKRRDTYALYAFFRLADNIVDAPDIVNQAGLTRAHRELGEYRQAWTAALTADNCTNPVLYTAAHVCRKYQIPDSYSDRFLCAMEMDLTDHRYRTYADLMRYMEGSAAAVGLMMSYVIGFSDISALPHLANLGNAMQLTNFLRDVEEDYHVYNRIYIPLEDMERYGLTEDDIANRRYSDAWKQLIEFEANRATGLYADAEIGIQMLRPDSRRPIRIASVLYGAILGKLRQKEWNVFAGRAQTNVFEKVYLTLQTAARV
jgi:phytoene synthase